MAFEVDLARLVLAAVAVLGYIPVLIAYRRHGITWMFSAYTALVIGALSLVGGSMMGLSFTPFIARLTVAITAILFLVAAYKSGEQIDALEAEAAKDTVTLGGDADGA